MSKLRENGLMVAAHNTESGWDGFVLDEHMANDGCSLNRKLAVIWVYTQPAVNDTLVVGGKTYTFKKTAVTADQIAIGNLLANGDFAGSGANWENNGAWVIDATGALHTAGVGNTKTLAQRFYPQVVAGKTYVVTTITSGRSAGSLVASIGGVAGATITADATTVDTIVALTSGDLVFTPTATFNGKITSVTVTEATSNLNSLTAANIVAKINRDKALTTCTAYMGESSIGEAKSIVLVCNSVGQAAPTFSSDGAKVAYRITWADSLTQVQLDDATLFSY